MQARIFRGSFLFVLVVVGAGSCGNSALPVGAGNSGGTSSGGVSSAASSGGDFSNLAGGTSSLGDVGTSSTSSAPCDPLAPPAITLGQVLGVGQDAQGTVYVADQAPDYITRVFVVKNGVLVRQYVTGSGQRGGLLDTDYTLSFQDSYTATSTPSRSSSAARYASPKGNGT